MSPVITGSQPPSQPADDIARLTKTLSSWARAINLGIVTAVWLLFTSEKRVPSGIVSSLEWHEFLWIAGSAILALAVDCGQVLADLRLKLNKLDDIEAGIADRVIIGRREPLFLWGWRLFYIKLALTLLNALASLALFTSIVPRWHPN